MKPRLKLLLLYFFYWLALFELLRIVFLIYHAAKTKGLPLATTFLTFWYGARMDISISSYLLLPVCIFLLLSLWFAFFRKQRVYNIYTGIVLFIILLISLSDLEVYRQWGFRIDASILKYLNTPREAYSSISNLPLAVMFSVCLVCYILLFWIFRRMFKRSVVLQEQKSRLVKAVLLLLVMGFLIIPMRGGLQLAPINQSTVYFSTNNYANHAAINASWNFMNNIFSRDINGINPYQYLTATRSKQIVDSLYRKGPLAEPLVRFSSDTPTNVIIIIWESFTEKALHVLLNNQEVAPNFMRLKQEGIYFSNLYASGDRTDKGVPAILSGYPAMPNNSIIHSPGKSRRLRVLSQLFKEKGYQTPFFYGGEPEFANIKSFLLHAGFDPIIGKQDFAEKDMNSKWGAHDGIVMNRVFNDLNRSKQPFFATWLTLSSHEPFETPVPVVFPGKDVTTKFLNSLHYTDQCVADLIAKCSSQPWWAHTLMIITGDHGHPLPETNNKADNFRSPMLWLGGALNKKGIVIDKVISQLDIAATVAQQAGMDSAYFPFSKNILKTGPESWAFFTFNNGFGFIDASGRTVFDNVGKRPILVQGKAGPAELEAGKAMQRLTYEDFLKK